MKDVRPKIKKLLTNFSAPKWDPYRTFVSLPRRDAPDIPFCHYQHLKTMIFKGIKFEVLEFKNSVFGGIECILRITIDGILYHVSTYPQSGNELLYTIYFCKCDDLPDEIRLQYTEKNPRGFFNVSVTDAVEIHYEYRSDNQEHLDTDDPEVIEFFQYMLNLCRDFYLGNRPELDAML